MPRTLAHAQHIHKSSPGGAKAGSPLGPGPLSSPIPSLPNRGGAHQLKFRPSPFYEVLEFVSSIVQVPEAPAPSGRRQVVLAFTLSPKQREMLHDTPDRYQLRLFCTTFEHYMASWSTSNAAPIEFPYTSEARVNDKPLGVSLKGNKKHPGRVSPPDINRHGSVHLQQGRLNRVEVAYANTPTVRLLSNAASCNCRSAMPRDDGRPADRPADAAPVPDQGRGHGRNAA